MSVTCKRCDKTWPRDSVLEVERPTCHAAPGSPCVVRRPSGYNHSAAFGGLPDWGHDTRDLAADAAGAYGPCPSGRCGRTPTTVTALPRPRRQTAILPSVTPPRAAEEQGRKPV